MKMIGKLIHESFKTFLRSKKLILASSHGCNAFGGILTHGLPGHFHEAKYVEIPAGGISACVPLATQSIHGR